MHRVCTGTYARHFFDQFPADGFKIELAASEPFIEAPVGIDFDNHGRMWVVEMRGYMRDLAATGDDLPTGRISILEDKDKDGYNNIIPENVGL